MKVNIYIYISQKGKFQGKGKASALLEYADSRGRVYTRKVDIAEKNCTRNSLALEVIVMALKMLVKPCEVTIYTDNSYIKSCVLRGWVKRWQQDSWKKPDGETPANLGFWKSFYLSMKIHRIKFMKYEGRIGNAFRNNVKKTKETVGKEQRNTKK